MYIYEISIVPTVTPRCPELIGAKIRRGVQYGSRYLIPGLAKLGGGGEVVQLYSGQLNFVINRTTSIVVYDIKFKPNYITVIVRILYM